MKLSLLFVLLSFTFCNGQLLGAVPPPPDPPVPVVTSIAIEEVEAPEGSDDADTTTGDKTSDLVPAIPPTTEEEEEKEIDGGDTDVVISDLPVPVITSIVTEEVEAPGGSDDADTTTGDKTSDLIPAIPPTTEEEEEKEIDGGDTDVVISVKPPATEKEEKDERDSFPTIPDIVKGISDAEEKPVLTLNPLEEFMTDGLLPPPDFMTTGMLPPPGFREDVKKPSTAFEEETIESIARGEGGGVMLPFDWSMLMNSGCKKDGVRVWMCQLKDYRNSLLLWKAEIESWLSGCAQSFNKEMEAEWFEAFKCSRSPVKCRNGDSMKICDGDARQCQMCECIDGEYENDYIDIMNMWREEARIYQKGFELYRKGTKMCNRIDSMPGCLNAGVDHGKETGFGMEEMLPEKDGMGGNEKRERRKNSNTPGFWG